MIPWPEKNKMTLLTGGHEKGANDMIILLQERRMG
jgi:hypothetical protein